jgi:hypothetical protein
MIGPSARLVVKNKKTSKKDLVHEQRNQEHHVAGAL